MSDVIGLELMMSRNTRAPTVARNRSAQSAVEKNISADGRQIKEKVTVCGIDSGFPRHPSCFAVCMSFDLIFELNFYLFLKNSCLFVLLTGWGGGGEQHR